MKKILSILMLFCITVSCFAYDFIYITKDAKRTYGHYLVIQVTNPTEEDKAHFKNLKFAFNDENNKFTKVHFSNYQKGPGQDGEAVFQFYYDLDE